MLLFFSLFDRNILLTNLKKVKLGDFSISRMMDTSDTSSFLTECCGTVFYMSPEILDYDSKYGFKTDVW